MQIQTKSLKKKFKTVIITTVMQKLKFDSKKRALTIVAHPDDETIWMGGFILTHPQMDWTIFSLCRASDPDRAPKFKKICKHYGAEAIIADLEDDGKLSLKQTLPIIKKLILKNIIPSRRSPLRASQPEGDTSTCRLQVATATKQEKFDYIFTHGANGEYGHPRHIGIHQVVKQLIQDKLLQPKTIFYFNYKKTSQKKFSPLTACRNSDLILKLTKVEFAKKKKIMTDIYGFNSNGIDVGYCTNPEAFKIQKIKYKK